MYIHNTYITIHIVYIYILYTYTIYSNSIYKQSINTNNGFLSTSIMDSLNNPLNNPLLTLRNPLTDSLCHKRSLKGFLNTLYIRDSLPHTF